MGGWGSGGGRNATKLTSLRRIDLADLRRLNMLREIGPRLFYWSRNGERVASVGVEYRRSCLVLDYRVRNRGEDWVHIREEIPLARTEQKFGGERLWLVCLTCRCRCRTIFAGDYFRCRKCYRATYPSQYEDADSRLISRAEDVRIKLGASGSMDEPFPRKPKWMRWKTYHRLSRKDEIASERFWNMLGELDERF
ncbi:hypothetical protein PUV54_11325 [Hyphococcus flavus]|uniref:Uncharacterized protein n=1 Tax=Hyphococcus flavus TaxID=1866326 RepID=A0AAE9ZCP4_9PROT|nr:hypothetical protein [Hyphococcus flavus]WDI30547.1 hypothetical protein PUV54_11325 [Hyphococcus flavus]